MHSNEHDSAEILPLPITPFAKQKLHRLIVDSSIQETLPKKCDTLHCWSHGEGGDFLYHGQPFTRLSIGF